MSDVVVLRLLAQHGSASAAARTLRATTSYVTKVAQRLNRAFGEPLVEQSRTGLALSPAGRALLVELGPMLARLESRRAEDEKERWSVAAPS